MKRLVVPAVLAAALALTGCGHRSSAEAEITDPKMPTRYGMTHPGALLVTEDDITDRPYITLGDVTVTVSKNTLFDADPNHAHAEAKLREAASQMGAHAVVLTRYGAVGISLWSWGTLEAKGRAVRFTG